MTIRFQDYSDGKFPNLKFSPGLVLGWLTTEAQDETRFALYADGRILQSEPVSMFGPGRDDFSTTRRKWTQVAAVPAHAEFIGNYPPPVK